MGQYLVTGANRGLGLEFVKQLLARGERVIATCRHPGRATALNHFTGDYPGHLKVLPLDASDTRSIASLAHDIALLETRLDVLIHNAGMLVSGEEFGKVEAQALSHTFATNAMGPFLLSQALAAQLSDGGKLIAISSGLGSIARTQRFGTPSYDISKAALNMAMRLLGHALADRRIAVLALSPGWVKTDMGGENAELQPAQSIGNMLKVVDALEFEADNVGQFRGNDGKPIPW